MILTDHLRDALAELKKNIELPHSDIARERPDLIPTFRTAAIKSFEYAYEMSIRLIRRSLEARAASPQEIEDMDFRPMMRTAAEKGLIDEPLVWVLFREKRNITAHTYDETKAIDVLAILPQFLAKATALLDHVNATPHAR